MTKLTISPKPEVGTLNSLADPRIPTDFTQIETWANGEIDEFNLKKEGIPEEKLAKVIQEKLGGSFVGLKVEEKTANFEGASAFLYNCTKEITCTFPAATAGRTIGVLSNFATGPVKVSAKAGKVVKVGFAEAETATLTNGMAAVFEADGTNWWKIAGEVKNENKYSAIKTFTKAEAEAEVETSATRPALLTLVATEKAQNVVSVGAVTVAQVPAAVAEAPVTVEVLPGQKWKATRAVEASWLLR